MKLVLKESSSLWIQMRVLLKNAHVVTCKGVYYVDSVKGVYYVDSVKGVG